MKAKAFDKKFDDNETDITDDLDLSTARQPRQKKLKKASTTKGKVLQKKNWLMLPVISTGAEYLVMGNLMRRNILTYKAPEGNEGYDLICIHPEPRYKPKRNEVAQVRIQVKSRYQTDCNRGFPIKEKALDAFDFLIVAFMNIGKYYGKNDGLAGAMAPEFYTLTPEFVKKHHNISSSWQKVSLTKLQKEIEPFKNEAGFELIAKALGVPFPSRKSTIEQ